MDMTKRFIRQNGGYAALPVVANEVEVSAISELKPGMVKFSGKFGSWDVRHSKNKSHLVIYSTSVRDDSGSVKATWFNSPRMREHNKNSIFYFYGKASMINDELVVQAPKYCTPSEYKKWSKIYNDFA